MSSIFACGLRFHRKTVPYFSLLVSLLFSTNSVCKNADFSLAASFPNNRISKVRIFHHGWFRKTCISPCIVSQNEKQNSRKNYTAIRDMQKFSSFRGKKISLRSHRGVPSIDFYGGRGGWEYCFTFYMSAYVFLLAHGL